MVLPLSVKNKYKTVDQGINLIPKEYKESPRGKSLKKLLSNTSFLFIGLYTLVLICLFAFTFYLNYVSNNRQAVNSKIIQEISQMQTVEELLHTIKNRTEIARNIFAGASPIATENFDKIIKLIPEDLSITVIETNDKSVLLSVYTSNLMSIEKFLTVLEKANLKSVSLSSLTSVSGNYSVNINVQ